VIERVLDKHRCLRIEYFPAYAPQWHPDEGIWSLTKRKLAEPKDTDELIEDIVDSIDGVRNSQQKLRG